MTKSTKKTFSSLERNPLVGPQTHGEAEHNDQTLPTQVPLQADIQSPIRRRKFLGMGLLGFAGFTLPSLPVFARPTENKVLKNFVSKVLTAKEETYWDRTDRFEEKMKLLQSAWERKDYRLVRALTHSLRVTGIQAQAEDENPEMPLLGASQYGIVASLPASWRAYAQGWKYYKVLTLEEKAGVERKAEPVEVLLGFSADQVSSLNREIRVAQLDGSALNEVTSQVFGELRRGGEWFCKLLFLADSQGREKNTFLVFYGNPDAELPEYPTDLVITGEGYGLDIENAFFKAYLSKQTGQLERMTLKREHGLEIYSGGEGHGERPGIDWAHDYVTEGFFQKLRISLWDECPDYEVVRGPICTIIRRWGFPYSPVHPLFSPSRMNMDVEYRFYAGLPYFHKFGHMTAVKDFEASAMRDDEWVITGQSFTDMMWMGPDAKLQIGEVNPEFKDKLWGIGFFNKDTKDSFVGLFLEHRADGLPELLHSGSPQLYYKWNGQIWSRYPLPPDKQIPAGAVLHQKNAYVTLPFTITDGPGMIEELRHRLMNPLLASKGEVPKQFIGKDNTRRLARPGEAGDSRIPKGLLWAALGNVKDLMLYTADISIVDLGLVYDISVRGDVVKVVFAMPHRGRPLGGYFTHGKASITISNALKQVPGVGKVITEQSWYPEWSSNKLTDEGRRKLEL